MCLNKKKLFYTAAQSEDEILLREIKQFLMVDSKEIVIEDQNILKMFDEVIKIIKRRKDFNGWMVDGLIVTKTSTVHNEPRGYQEIYYDHRLESIELGKSVLINCYGRYVQTTNVQEIDDDHPGRFRTERRWYSPNPKDKDEGR